MLHTDPPTRAACQLFCILHEHAGVLLCCCCCYGEVTVVALLLLLLLLVFSLVRCRWALLAFLMLVRAHCSMCLRRWGIPAENFPFCTMSPTR